MLQPYKLIIWDWNGTLFNDLALTVSIFNQVLEERRLAPISEQFFKENLKFPIDTFYTQIGFRSMAERESAKRRWNEVYESCNTLCTLQPGAAGLLERINKAGRKQVMLSAHEQRSLHRMASFTGITPHFARISGASESESGSSKISRGVALLEVMTRDLAISPKEVVMIGDSVHDHEVAESLGIDCILSELGHVSSGRLVATGRPVIRSFDQLTL